MTKSPVIISFVKSLGSDTQKSRDQREERKGTHPNYQMVPTLPVKKFSLGCECLFIFLEIKYPDDFKLEWNLNDKFDIYSSDDK